MKLKNQAMEALEEAKHWLRSRCPDFPKIVVVLGSGLSELLNEIKISDTIPYSEIPHVKSATVEGHTGRLLIGRLNGVPVVCMQGRLHYYEGHSLEEVVFPFRALGLAGAEIFLLTNAAGGLTTDLAPPTLVLIRDHINLMGSNPLIGPNLEALGPRFPDMTRLYDLELRAIVSRVAHARGISIPSGVYVGIHGPSYETPAEISMYRKLGADVVGMSTVPEAISLHHMGKRVVAISCITNLAAGVTDQPLVHEEVLKTAKRAYDEFSTVIKDFVREVGGG